MTEKGILKGCASIPSCRVLALGVVASNASEKTLQVTVSVKVLVMEGTVA